MFYGAKFKHNMEANNSKWMCSRLILANSGPINTKGKFLDRKKKKLQEKKSN